MIIFSRHPVVEISVTCSEDKMAWLESLIRVCSLDYGQLERGMHSVCFRDINGKGKDLSTFMKELEATMGEDPEKIWVLIRAKRKEKKNHAGETGKETGAGSESGNSGEAGVDSGHGQAD